VRITCDIDKVARNAEAVVRLCSSYGISVAGVTKCLCGEPVVAKAMLDSGCTSIADSRLDNIRRLRDADLDCEILLLRLPALSEVDNVVALCDASLVSEVETARALSAAASRRGTVHSVLLMIENGDRREGLMAEDAVDAALELERLDGIELTGIGTVLNCLCGVLPTRRHHEKFIEVLDRVEMALGRRLATVSGGCTGDLHLVRDGVVPARVNHLRVGQAILTGSDFTTWAELPIPFVDAFKVYAEVIEIKCKPSAPDGSCGPDAFMRVRDWPDEGVRRRAILAMGDVDLSTSALRPTQPGVRAVGASSDHFVVDVTEMKSPVRLGEELEFVALYPAISTGWSSICTTKEFL